MTIELSKETEALIERVLARGDFRSAEHVIQYALSAALTEQETEDETYNAYLRGLLEESEQAIAEGRVRRFTTDTHHELWEDIERRGRERLEGDKQAH